MKKKAPLLALWLVLLVAGMAVGRQQRQDFAPLMDRQRERGDIMLDVFGEFRTVMARYLWFKMDLFHEVLDDEGISNEKQAEVLPLLRMVSLLDPSITDAYDNIAWDLYHGHHEVQQALGILDEGIARNPQNFSLKFRKATILYKEKRYREALAVSQDASPLAVEEFDRLNAHRLTFWAAKQVGDKNMMSQSLDRLLELRPTDQLWLSEKAQLQS